MAEDESKTSKASRFLKKSKWVKVLKEREPSEDDPPAPARAGAFTLDNDVVDFLKPSTEKSKPKLDIAIARRWPEAHQVRALGEDSPGPDGPTFTKPRRRKGLTVGFAKTAPEIIGEGGDDAPDPPTEIGRRKAAMGRSVSDATPAVRSLALPMHGQPTAQARGYPPQPPEETPAAPPIRRINTSHREFSPPISRKLAAPPVGDIEPLRPSIGRVNTGLGNSTTLQTPGDDSASSNPPPSRQQPGRLDTEFQFEGRPSAAGLGSIRAHLAPESATSDEASSPVVQKRREMTRNEGMAFRRASMLVKKDSEEDEIERSSGEHEESHKPPAIARHSGDSGVYSSTEALSQSPEIGITPDAPNPVADREDTTRHLRDASPSPQHQLEPPTQSLGQDLSEREVNNHAQIPLPPPRSPLRGIYATRASPQPSMAIPIDHARDNSRSPRLSDRLFDASTSSQQSTAVYSKPNGSSSSVNRFPNRSSHSRPSSRDDGAPPRMQSAGPGSQPPYSSRVQNGASSANSPRSSLLVPGRTGASPAPLPVHRTQDYVAATTIPPPSKSPAAVLRHEEKPRPLSSSSTYSLSRPAAWSLNPTENNPAADAAFADFEARVAHMRGVFRLTAEKELSGDRCTPSMWLRAALWWYHTGKTGLEALFARRGPNERRELLTQPHVDLAKTWWILRDPLNHLDMADGEAHESDPNANMIRRSIAALKSSLKTLSLSLTKNHMLPPESSLIQGQNTQIWIEYPRFTSDVQAVLGGSVSSSVLVQDSKQAVDPYEVLPLNDTNDHFWYGRFPVEVYLHTEDLETDRVMLPCLLTVLRGRHDYQTSVTIASQSELVNIKIMPQQDRRRGLTWSDVSWEASPASMSIRLPRNFDLSVRMQERDYRALWNLSEYARKVERTMQPNSDERLVHECRLTELQYVDSSNSSSFPSEKIRGCSAFIFERTDKHVGGTGTRRLHRGYRLLLVTDPGHKTLSAVSHDICGRSPFYFEFLTDSAAGGTTAMVVRIWEAQRQCRILLVFPDAGSRQSLYNIINGLAIRSDESIVGKMVLASLNIEPASPSLSFSQSGHVALQKLNWQKLGITNSVPDDSNSRFPATIESESLRILARHDTGCITDRVNLGKGELLLRLPPSDSPSVQILRDPQEDMTVSIDTRQSHATVVNGIAEVLKTVLEQQTIRTFTFQSHSDLHAFQAAVTGCNVRFDGMAASLDISRRRMVVPIYKKWQAQSVRIQIVSQGQIVQLLAFMEEFSHADALCFQVKSTDVFETHKGDSKGKKWTVKMVDAKFTLPNREKGKDENAEEQLKNRFVNLENLEYAEEHDDITIGFDTEQGKSLSNMKLHEIAHINSGTRSRQVRACPPSCYERLSRHYAQATDMIQTTRVERIFLGTGDPRPTGREFPWWGQGKAKGQLEMFGVI